MYIYIYIYIILNISMYCKQLCEVHLLYIMFHRVPPSGYLQTTESHNHIILL